MKILKKMSEDKSEKDKEKKIENPHEKVTINFNNQAKNLKDLLG